MTNPITEKQINIWKNELATAMDHEQWQIALKFCGWLRYALRQQDSSDPEVDEMQRRAKKALAKQLAKQLGGEEEAYKMHQKRRSLAMHHIICGEWEQALTLIEALYKDGTDQKEVIDFLQEFKERAKFLLTPSWQREDPQAAALTKRFDKLVEKVASGSAKIMDSLR